MSHLEQLLGAVAGLQTIWLTSNDKKIKEDARKALVKIGAKPMPAGSKPPPKWTRMVLSKPELQ